LGEEVEDTTNCVASYSPQYYIIEATYQVKYN
jgi:hypothetical protein